MLKELLGLTADINPTEIASHIAQGNLADWCDSWRKKVEATIMFGNNKPIVAVEFRAGSCIRLHCPVCGKQQKYPFYPQNSKHKLWFCERCGQALKWE